MARNAKVAFCALSTLLASTVICPSHGAAQSFNEAIVNQLSNGCEVLNGGERGAAVIPGLGAQLSNICAIGFGSSPPPGATASASGIGSVVTNQAVQQRLKSLGQSQDQQAAAGDQPNLLASNSSDIQVSPQASGVSVWLSAGADYIDHNRNRFEDGYNGTQPVLTVGADYRFTEWLSAGIAFNYVHFSGDYDDGGRFNSNSFGPLIYVNATPMENTFIDVVMGYSRQETFRSRDAQYIDEAGLDFGGSVSGSPNTNIYTLSTLFGYDHPIDNVTIGPRLGFNVAHYDVRDFEEDGNTGLEVKYTGLSRTSIQTALGATATMAISLPFGVAVPQVSASWIHEYGLDQRNAQGQFVQDLRPDPSTFDFTYYEAPDRNYALIGAGVVLALPNRWQPFINFTTIQANDNVSTYGGVAGLRVQL